MRIRTSILLLAGIALCAQGEPIAEKEKPNDNLLYCLFDEDTMGCFASRLARDIDQMEVQTMGKVNGPPMSTVIAKTGQFVAEVADDLRNPEGAEEPEEADEPGHEEARKKKLGKRKKKHLQKLLGLAMLFKAKISLLLQLISTHFQLKFFAIAIISLILNAARFWLDLKKGHHPAKVIYYEHAQHQHHYDHDEHDQNNYWGRSSDGSPQDLAYAAHVPKN